MPKALLFDLDGTLLDSVDDLTVAINNTLAAYSLPSITREDVTLFIGKGAKVLVTRALTKVSGMTPDAMRLDEIYNRYLKEMQLAEGTRTKKLPGVPDALEKLRNHGYKMAIVTNKPAAIARRLAAQFNLISYFETIVGAGDVPNVKPNCQMLVEAAHRMGVSIRDCVMIGDSMNDSLAAQNAGIRALLLKTGYNEGVMIDQWAKEHAPSDLIFDTMAELAQFLLKNERRN